MDLSLFLRELDAEILGSLEYNTDLYARDSIVRMIGHFTRLAESAGAAPDAPVGTLGMLTDAERADLAAWNATSTDYPRVLVQDLVSAQLLVGADRVAVRQGTSALTYAQLDGRANRIAHRLRSMGVQRGQLVGVCVDRTVDLPAALLGVLKAGAAYVPLDAAFPAARLTYMLQDAGVEVVVSQRDLSDRLPSGNRAVLWLEDLAAGPLPDEAPPCDATPDDRAYVIYTSGSTGRPKGVEVLHRNVVNFLNAMRDRPGVRSDDVLVAVTTPTFDIAALELFLPLTVGARVEVAPTATAMHGAHLTRLLADAGATVMQATPATWRALLDAGWAGHPGLRALVGGEALPPDLAARLLPLVTELWNMYGPTETTIWSTCARVLPGDALSIGTPIGNTITRVIDRNGQELPVGVAGELLIGGAGVARGYLGRPELTQSQFVVDRSAGEAQGRAYRTGDLVKRRPDGMLEHLGRLDDQLKVQGFRIEPGEVEAILRLHPLVSDAVISVHRDEGAQARLVAWVVYRNGEQPTVSDIRRYLRNELPPYMVPGMIIQLDAIPRTMNGKVDRSALPNPLRASSASHSYEALATPSEHIIADAWTPLLNVSRIGRTDNFFELGGHSLLSMRAVAAIEERCGVRIDPRTFFFQTVQQIAVLLDRQRGTAA
jgi:amino acid adenylation domain-containing protein